MNNNEAKLQQFMLQPETVRTHELSSILDRYGDKIKLLSLDCFDTILWRKTAAPRDVFFNLAKNKTFNSLGFNAFTRISAEGKTRQMMALSKGSIEVTLKDIYQNGFCPITDEQVEQMIKDELEAEIDACYAFFPMLELIEAAHQRNIKIIIVSDTYLKEQQLRFLLSKTMPSSVLDKISAIYCSCEYGKSKTNGIFFDVLKKSKLPPEAILHIGDNLAADYVMPRALNLNALHFVQQDESINNLIRLQDISAKMLNPAISSTHPLYMPFRPVLSLGTGVNVTPETIIGYASLGSIMYPFAQFICQEYDKLLEENKKPKLIFLMRDGYLPYLACTELAGKEIGKKVRISRFASYAASFCTAEDVDSYLIEIGATDRFYDVARQLLLPEKVYEPLITVAMRSENPSYEFCKQIRRPDIVRIILNKSKSYRERLMRHLESEIGLEKGDTLVFVDLGYSGTAQRRLAPVFNKMGIDVVGRYLLSLRIPGWETNRRGLIDPSWCEDRAAHTLVMYITLLEQLCTSNEKSVIDYDDKGVPIYSDVVMSDHQHQKLLNIQSECVRFIRDAKQFYNRSGFTIPSDMLRQAALNELTRLIFFSTEQELQYLQSFQAEMNLGTKDILQVFNPEQGLIGLRRRGMFYMEKPSKKTRTNYPAELRAAGIELVLSLIAQHRFGLDLKLKDMSIRKEFLQIIFRQGNETFKTTTDAVATHDGFFALWLPTQNTTEIVFGEKYKWMQIESAEYIPMQAFASQTETQNTADAWSSISYDKITDHGGKVLELLTPESKIIAAPVSKSNTNEFVLRIVFRPIMKHMEQAVEKVADTLVNA